MNDNRQVASVLALIAGILTLGLALLFGLIFSFVGSFVGFGMMDGMGGAESIFLGLMGAFWAVVLVIGLGAGITLLMAAARLKDESPEVRRTWAIWAIVAGAVSFIGPGGLLTGGLAVAAGIVTLMDLNRQAPPARAP